MRRLLLALAVLAAPPLAAQEPTADAVDRAFDELVRRLHDHPFFSRVDYSRHDSDGPFVYLIQRPDKADPGYPKRVADFYGKWLRELESIFREEYAAPLELERRADYPVYFIAVLSSPGAYSDYSDAVRVPGLLATRAHYNPELRLSVTYTNPFRPEPKSEERRAALHELVHAMEHAYSVADDRPTSAFFSEGLADFLSAHQGVMPGALRAHPLDRDALGLVLAVAGSRETVEVHLPPIEELVALETYQDVFEHFTMRASELERGLLPPEQAIALLYAQAGLWMHYLHRGEGGKHRDAILRYVQAVELGQGGVDGLVQAFAGTSLADLNAGFRRHVNDQIKTQFKSEAGGRRLTGKPTPLPGWEATATRVVTAAATLAPGALAPDTSDPEVRFAQVLALAAAGRYATAAAELRAVVEDAPDESGDLPARMERELERLDGMVALRRRFLEHLPTVKKKLLVELPQGRLLAHVASVDDEHVYVKKNRLGLERLALEEIDGVQLADAMRDRKAKFPAPGLLAYPYLLAGDERWERHVVDGAPETAGLRRDAVADYPALLHLARTVGALERLSRHPATSGGEVDDGEALFATVTELVRTSSDLTLVHERRAALRALGRRGLEAAFATSGLSQVLAGAYEDLGGGRIRLTYDFDSDAELADFREDDYLEEILEGWGKETTRRRRITDGKLRSEGFLCLRHVLELRGETALECTFRSLEPRGAYDPRAALLFGLFDDGLGSFALVESNGSLRVIDPRNQHMQFAEASGGGMYFDRKYTLRASSDGKHVRSRLNGKDRGRVEAGGRTEGGVFVWSYADYPVELERLVIEGEPTEGSLALLSDTWVEERLALAGL